VRLSRRKHSPASTDARQSIDQRRADRSCGKLTRQRAHMAMWAAATAASVFGSEPAAWLIKVASSR
jgi:hypothetical protein